LPALRKSTQNQNTIIECEATPFEPEKQANRQPIPASVSAGMLVLGVLTTLVVAFGAITIAIIGAAFGAASRSLIANRSGSFKHINPGRKSTKGTYFCERLPSQGAAGRVCRRLRRRRCKPE